MQEPIMVTTSIYDFIKDRIRRKRVTPAEEQLLTAELQTAKQVVSRELPENVVKVGSRVSIKDHTLGIEKEYHFVGMGKSKPSKGRYAIDSSIALATLGRKEGNVIDWTFDDSMRKIEILSVKNTV
ncbi:regulator of nucleoside diphosphate kinase [Algoriphagus ratkowskyi]|uniref:Regulator of nucleoside diphosphate kinase n=1 Tax=Algoriphagus ratkowskyi TaxID=57028 RepID=A0A2W7QYC5_9BACT|nr:GreA/GreB family elongation factor [Algoriphagus ratkowskyi]PZX53508.1 regulator of nucleoside diphosphate kinase [Algoriphagus ratkowskyi]TXD76462.1 transcription elongation factor GreAB [Algoriphagus ratkowskyi]